MCGWGCIGETWFWNLIFCISKYSFANFRVSSLKSILVFKLIASCSPHVLWNLKTFVCMFLCMTLLVSIMLGIGLRMHDNLINNKSTHTTWASCYYALQMIVKWWKKLEIKFNLNENIEWHCKQLELNSNLIDFSLNSIELKFNWIE